MKRLVLLVLFLPTICNAQQIIQVRLERDYAITLVALDSITVDGSAFADIAGFTQLPRWTNIDSLSKVYEYEWIYDSQNLTLTLTNCRNLPVFAQRARSVRAASRLQHTETQYPLIKSKMPLINFSSLSWHYENDKLYTYLNASLAGGLVNYNINTNQWYFQRILDNKLITNIQVGYLRTGRFRYEAMTGLSISNISYRLPHKYTDVNIRIKELGETELYINNSLKFYSPSPVDNAHVPLRYGNNRIVQKTYVDGRTYESSYDIYIPLRYRLPARKLEYNLAFSDDERYQYDMLYGLTNNVSIGTGNNLDNDNYFILSTSPIPALSGYAMFADQASYHLRYNPTRYFTATYNRNSGTNSIYLMHYLFQTPYQLNLSLSPFMNRVTLRRGLNSAGYFQTRFSSGIKLSARINILKTRLYIRCSTNAFNAISNASVTLSKSLSGALRLHLRLHLDQRGGITSQLSATIQTAHLRADVRRQDQEYSYSLSGGISPSGFHPYVSWGSGGIRGRVLLNDIGVHGVRIHIGGKVAITDKNGNYHLTDLSAYALHTLTVDKSSLPHLTFSNIEAASVFVFPNSSSRVDISLSGAVELFGRVEDSDANTLASITVVLSNNIRTISLTSYSDGVLYHQAIPEGTYTVTLADIHSKHFSMTPIEYLVERDKELIITLRRKL